MNKKFIARIITITCICFPLINHSQTSDKEIVYSNNIYTITTENKIGEVGEIISIHKKENNTSITIGNGAIYFVDVIDNYIIIDEGTGVYRGVIIYDMVNQKKIMETSYMGELQILGNEIYFWQEVRIKNEKEKPKCPQSIIDIGYGICYLENLIYDIKKKKLIRTQKYTCSYCE